MKNSQIVELQKKVAELERNQEWQPKKVKQLEAERNQLQ